MSTHIGAKKGDIAETILLPGDPLRAKFIAENYLEDVKQYNNVRGMYGFTGTYKGKRISTQGTGMGMPSISIYVNELIRDYGVKNLIRVGSCGSFSEKAKIRDVILVKAACSNSNLNKMRFDGKDFAAASSFKLLSKAYQIAQEQGTDVKVGTILSSSAALEVVTALGICDLHEIEINGVEMALLAQRAENNFVGVQCGIMDQYISRLGKKDHALLIDCRTNDYQLVPFKNEDYQIVICNSKVERGLVDSEYNQRRKECNLAVEFFAANEDDEIRALRDLDLKTVKKYKDDLETNVYKRAHHVVSENDRVLESQKALKNDDMLKFGELMYNSHKSLSEDYEVSCKELDILVNIAKSENITGARMTGAGFGGSTVNLVKKEKLDDFVTNIKKQYKEKTGIEAEIYISNPGSGARKL